MDIKKFIPEYESMTGAKLPAEVIGIIERIDAIGQKLQHKGSQDAAWGLPAPSEEVVQAWSKQLVGDKVELLEELAGLLRIYYMEGYEQRANREKREVPA